MAEPERDENALTLELPRALVEFILLGPEGDLKIENGTIKDGPVEGLPDRSNIAFLQGIVAASLRFDEVLGAVVPMTSWWRDKGGASMLRQFDKARTQIDDGIDAIR